MTLTHEWQEYDMDYQKAVQDIRTKDGKEYLNCWPNAGKWCVMSDNDQSDIPDADVTHVKLNESWMSEEQEAIAEGRPLDKILLIGEPQYGVSIAAQEMIKQSEIETINMLNMRPMSSIGTIGHVDHTRSTLQAAMATMLMDRANEPDMQNIGPAIGYNCNEQQANELEKALTITNPYPTLAVEEYTDIIGPYHKKRKPNSGLKIGSYRYKGK